MCELVIDGNCTLYHICGNGRIGEMEFMRSDRFQYLHCVACGKTVHFSAHRLEVTLIAGG